MSLPRMRALALNQTKMAKIAKVNFFSDGKSFEKGKAYEDADVAGLDASNFQESAADQAVSKPSEGPIGIEKDETCDLPAPDLDGGESPEEEAEEIAPEEELG